VVRPAGPRRALPVEARPGLERPHRRVLGRVEVVLDLDLGHRRAPERERRQRQSNGDRRNHQPPTHHQNPPRPPVSTGAPATDSLIRRLCRRCHCPPPSGCPARLPGSASATRRRSTRKTGGAAFRQPPPCLDLKRERHPTPEGPSPVLPLRNGNRLRTTETR